MTGSIQRGIHRADLILQHFEHDPHASQDHQLTMRMASCGAAVLHQPGDLMPVEVVDVDLGQQRRDAEPGEPCHSPCVHEQVVVVDGLVAGDGWFHGRIPW
ncbi:MAG: hypothetical protein WBE95_26160 [Trebonia sp.]|jgi:hypothetical protein